MPVLSHAEGEPPAPRPVRFARRPRPASGPPFIPVRLKPRHDGWTPARQFHFIDELAATRSVTRAARAVGISRESAYALLARSRACPEQRRAGFARAWERALAPDFATVTPPCQRSQSGRSG